MEEWLKKRAAIYTLIKYVDENNGNITINTDKVKRIFNDEEDIVMIEYSTGIIDLLANTDINTLNDIISYCK